MSITPTTTPTPTTLQGGTFLESMTRNDRVALGKLLENPNSDIDSVMGLVYRIAICMSRILGRREHIEYLNRQPDLKKNQEQFIGTFNNWKQLGTSLGSAVIPATAALFGGENAAKALSSGCEFASNYVGQSDQAARSTHQYGIDHLRTWQSDSNEAKQRLQNTTAKAIESFQAWIQSHHRAFETVS
ncbi:MAG: hypothetical protein WB791_05650 [Waddliaceae bacterium]